MTLANDNETPRHSIGVAARRTGLKPDLIRAWERRYEAVTPQRSDTRRRRYSDTQIRRLRLLRQAVEGSRNIGDIAHLPDSELEELIAGDAAAAIQPTAATGSGSPADDEEAVIEAILGACTDAVRRLDARALELELERASVALSRTHLLDRLLKPLMDRIGILWQGGSLRPVHEHLASSVVRSFVGGLRGAYESPAGAPRLVLTTPTGQRHELGALMAASAAAAEGWDVLYLGPDLPAEEMAAGVAESGARVMGVSITYPPDDPGLGAELERLRRLLPDGVHLVVGGRCAGFYREAVENADGQLIDDLGAFRLRLTELRLSG